MIQLEPQESNSPTPYQLLGGDETIRELLARFYGLMDLDPAFKRRREVHGSSLGSAREKLHLFLSGWLGGPSLYTDKYGHPMLRARHLPFRIGVEERGQWLACMTRAMEEVEIPQDLREALAGAFAKTADWMRNQ